MRIAVAPRFALLTVSAAQKANATVIGTAMRIIQALLRTPGQKFGSRDMNR